jgi:hypothetical protein
MGDRGRDAVLRKLNWAKEQEILLELYGALLSRAARLSRAPTHQELP